MGSKQNGQILYRTDARFAPCQWETALLCNDISHWLGPNLKSALLYISGWNLGNKVRCVTLKLTSTPRISQAERRVREQDIKTWTQVSKNTNKESMPWCQFNFFKPLNICPIIKGSETTGPLGVIDPNIHNYWSVIWKKVGNDITSIVLFQNDFSPTGEQPKQSVLAHTLWQPASGCIAPRPFWLPAVCAC